MYRNDVSFDVTDIIWSTDSFCMEGFIYFHNISCVTISRFYILLLINSNASISYNVWSFDHVFSMKFSLME